MKVLNRVELMDLVDKRVDSKRETLKKVVGAAKEIRVNGKYALVLMGASNNVYTIVDEQFAVDVKKCFYELSNTLICELNESDKRIFSK